MSNQTTKKHPIYRGAVKLVAKLRSIWLDLQVWYTNLILNQTPLSYI